jgi:hypothetical protein
MLAELSASKISEKILSNIGTPEIIRKGFPLSERPRNIQGKDRKWLKEVSGYNFC